MNTIDFVKEPGIMYLPMSMLTASLHAELQPSIVVVHSSQNVFIVHRNYPSYMFYSSFNIALQHFAVYNDPGRSVRRPEIVTIESR